MRHAKQKNRTQPSRPLIYADICALLSSNYKLIIISINVRSLRGEKKPETEKYEIVQVYIWIPMTAKHTRHMPRSRSSSTQFHMRGMRA